VSDQLIICLVLLLMFACHAYRSCRPCKSVSGPAAAQLVEDYDGTLFCHLINYKQHVLHAFLPEQNEHGYNLRTRPNNLSLSRTMDHRNFMPRLAFKTPINHYPHPTSMSFYSCYFIYRLDV